MQTLETADDLKDLQSYKSCVFD